MNTLKKIAMILVLVLFGSFLLSVGRPLWNNRGIKKVLETASVYGTKHTVQSTRKYLIKELKKKGFDFTEEDFEIDKDAHKTVRISITYTDEIRMFGRTLKEMEYTVEKTAYEIKEAW